MLEGFCFYCRATIPIVTLFLSWTAVLNITPTVHISSCLMPKQFALFLFFMVRCTLSNSYRGLEFYSTNLVKQHNWMISKLFYIFVMGIFSFFKYHLGFGSSLCSWFKPIIYVLGNCKVSYRGLMLRQLVGFLYAYSKLLTFKIFVRYFIKK